MRVGVGVGVGVRVRVGVGVGVRVRVRVRMRVRVRVRVRVTWCNVLCCLIQGWCTASEAGMRSRGFFCISLPGSEAAVVSGTW